MSSQPTRRPGTSGRSRGRRALGALTALGAASATLALTSGQTTASANPAADAATVVRSTTGAFSGLVPDGTCRVVVTARGGAGGSVILGLPDTNGAGAVISATYPVTPGQPYAGYVGGGGQPSTGASGQAGNGGPIAGLGGQGDPGSTAGSGGRGGNVGSGSSHAGAGGGGRTSVSIGGTELIVAAGGGGSAGGHDTQGGFGGDGGRPTAFGVVTPGNAGLDGNDASPQPAVTAGGGQGGQAAGPGAGGVHAANAALNGFAATADGVGGNGGNDPNYDSGGGGGGGRTGGGGGASTRENGSGNAVPDGNGGGGGGGGSSFASATTPGGLPGAPSGLTSSAGPRLGASHAGAGADGTVELDWVPCGYDLGVTKTASAVDPADGTVTWTVTVTNHGPDPMTRGDVVTLTDSLPGPGDATVVSVTAPAGVTCNLTGGATMTSPVVCHRAFDASAFGGSATGTRGLDPGESIVIAYRQLVTRPGAYPNTASVTDRGDPTNNTADEEVVVTGPSAGPRTSHGPQGQQQDRLPDVTAGTFPLDDDTLTLLDGPGGAPVDEVVVAGQGTFRIVDGDLVFEPEPDFLGTATPVHYRITDTVGNQAASTYTPTVIGANPDHTTGPRGETQTVDPLANDSFAAGIPVDPTTLVLLDGSGDPVTELVVDGVGTYVVVDGTIEFTPEPDFTGSHTVPYRVQDRDGVTVESTYTPTVPVGAPDVTSGPQGQPQDIDPLGNDTFGEGAPPVPATLTLLDPTTGAPVASVTIPDQGTYTVDRSDPANPRLVFTPEPDFIGTATPVGYRVLDTADVPVESTYTPTVTPVAVPDATTGPQGQLQTADPLANDDPPGERGLDPTTLHLVDPATGAPVDVVTVADVGTFTVVDGEIHFQPVPTFVGVGPAVGYQVDDRDGNTVGSTYTPTVTPVVPVANPDVTSGPLNQPQSVDPFGNDAAGDPVAPLDLTSLELLDPVSGLPVATVTVPEGVYSTENGLIIFTPVTGFVGTATPVTYRIADANGTTATSTYTPTIVAGPPEVLDSHQTHPVGTTVVFDLVDLEPDLDPGSVHLLDPNGNEVVELVVPGEGTWTVDPTTGEVTFVPEDGFEGDPTPVDWTGTKLDGTPMTGTLSIDYLQEATPPAPGTPDPTPGDASPAPTGSLPRTGANPWILSAAMLGVLLVLAGIAIDRTGRTWRPGRRSATR